MIDQLDLMTNKMENRHDPICGTDKYFTEKPIESGWTRYQLVRKFALLKSTSSYRWRQKSPWRKKKSKNFHLVKTKALRSCGHDDANSTATSPSPTTTTLAVGSEG